MQGRPIQEVTLPKKIHVDIAIESANGCVPAYEEREAAIFAGLSWLEYQNQEWYERADMVAHYRLHSLVERHVQEAIEHEQERKSRPKGGKRR